MTRTAAPRTACGSPATPRSGSTPGPQAKPPGGALREALRGLFAEQAKLRKVAMFTGGNFIINGIAKLLLKRLATTAWTLWW